MVQLLSTTAQSLQRPSLNEAQALLSELNNVKKTVVVSNWFSPTSQSLRDCGRRSVADWHTFRLSRSNSVTHRNGKAMKYTLFDFENNPAFWHGTPTSLDRKSRQVELSARLAKPSRGKQSEYGDAKRVVPIIFHALQSNRLSQLHHRHMRPIAEMIAEELRRAGAARSIRAISKIMHEVSGIPEATIRDWIMRADRVDRLKGTGKYRG